MRVLDFNRVAKVAFELVRYLGVEVFFLDNQIQFVVQEEASVVEIRGAYRCPGSIYKQSLCVKQSGLVLPDPHA